MVKSSRHSKIIGDFGEHLVCDALSKSGFEVLRVDHTGIDIIASNKSTKQLIGITVKSRTRDEGKENSSVNIFRQKGKDDRKKLKEACDAFRCDPWIAVYVENKTGADLYLTSLDTFNKYHGGKAVETWKMGEASKKKYIKDPNVKHIKMQIDNSKWQFS